MILGQNICLNEISYELSESRALLFLYLEACESNATSDWLKRMVYPIRSCVTVKFLAKKAVNVLENCWCIRNLIQRVDFNYYQLGSILIFNGLARSLSKPRDKVCSCLSCRCAAMLFRLVQRN